LHWANWDECAVQLAPTEFLGGVSKIMLTLNEAIIDVKKG
jgi:hypothetical protein